MSFTARTLAERELWKAREALAHVEHGADNSQELARYDEALRARNELLNDEVPS